MVKAQEESVIHWKGIALTTIDNLEHLLLELPADPKKEYSEPLMLLPISKVSSISYNAKEGKHIYIKKKNKE